MNPTLLSHPSPPSSASSGSACFSSAVPDLVLNLVDHKRLSSKCLSLGRCPRTVGSEVLMQDGLCRCTCVCALLLSKGEALFYHGKC